MFSDTVILSIVCFIIFLVVRSISKRSALLYSSFSVVFFALYYFDKISVFYLEALLLTLTVVLTLIYIAKFSTTASGIAGLFVTIFYAFIGISYIESATAKVALSIAESADAAMNVSFFGMDFVTLGEINYPIIFYIIIILWFIFDVFLISLRMEHNRRLYQLSSVLLIDSSLKGFISKSVYQGGAKGFCVPVLNCYACPSALFSCPLGAIQHFMVVGGKPENFKEFFANLPYYPLGLLGVIAAVVGRMCCGYLCPFGFLQDILYKIKSHKVRIPPFLRHIKYITLILLVFVLPLYLAENWFSKLCPMGTLIGGIPWVTINKDIRGMIKGIFWVKIAILMFFVTMSAISKRPFCQTSCPLGAIYSLFNRVSFFKLTWDSKSCTHCNKCEDICPMDIKVYEDPNSVDCIRCLDCTKCPSVALTHPLSALEEEEDILLSYKI